MPASASHKGSFVQCVMSRYPQKPSGLRVRFGLASLRKEPVLTELSN
jgi:hypothetical protein